jgi:hypothetical protein
MSDAQSDKPTHDPDEEMPPEFAFDYTKAKPNRFAVHTSGGLMILLEPDIAQVFTSAASVNSVLRAIIANLPPMASK